mmetsp:Transcript_104300/g.185426  ORF Transcript_104300/g.185426 Transcript_104300/m.185426 type:complete len:230 (+) Transcript_104300:32-721(+)
MSFLLALWFGIAALGAPCSQAHEKGSWSPNEKMAAYMRRCIVLAQEAESAGGAPYGALIVDPAKGIVVEGRNAASQNPIWHGEMSAITNLSDSILPTSVYNVAPGLELYTSAEPCPMCMGAISWSGFGRVVYGTSIPFISEHGGDQIMIRASEVVRKSFKKIILVEGFLRNETDPLYENAVSLIHIHNHSHSHSHLFGGRDFGPCLHGGPCPSNADEVAKTNSFNVQTG